MAKRNFGIFFEVAVRGRTSSIEQETFHNVLKQIDIADGLGYDAAWFVEHHFTRGFSHSSAPDLMLAAAARTTRNIKLGLGVVLLPFLSPIRVAERVATLDIISNGRVLFGTGRGASPLEYQAFKRPFEQSRHIWEEHLDAVLEIFSADGAEVTREGPYYKVPGVSVLPRTVQKPYPEVWVASTSLDGFLAAAERGYHLLCMPILKGIDGLAADVAAYKKKLADCGFDPSTRHVAMMVPWYVTKSGEDIEDVVSAFMWYIRRQVNLIAPPDYRDSQHATYRVFGQLAAGMSEEKALEELTRHRMIVIADVEGSKTAVDEFFAAGATDLIGQFEVGGIAFERSVSAMESFARDVAGFAK
jgi:alkanesulfonate monooxygenase SsuD/methylene tetrahydromethanopterin reductase-like flavin-dependent oxidoreductase (luciferase family)